jgi:hypothetical protein
MGCVKKNLESGLVGSNMFNLNEARGIVQRVVGERSLRGGGVYDDKS